MLTFSDHLGLLMDITRNSKKKIKPKASEIMSNQEDCKTFNESNLILCLSAGGMRSNHWFTDVTFSTMLSLRHTCTNKAPPENMHKQITPSDCVRAGLYAIPMWNGMRAEKSVMFFFNELAACSLCRVSVFLCWAPTRIKDVLFWLWLRRLPYPTLCTTCHWLD